MAEKPILFSGPMVRAILDGRKTQTRRIVKPQGKIMFPMLGKDNQPQGDWFISDPVHDQRLKLGRVSPAILAGVGSSGHFPPYAVGDRLWGREALYRSDGDSWLYWADNLPVMVAKDDETAMLVWAHHKQQSYCPSMHMPRWASRITLEVTDVRAQRVQEISEEDAQSEGCRAADLVTGRECLDPKYGSYRVHFSDLWDTVNGAGAWERNDWVWTYTYRRAA